jgi:excinuclease UvrABC nuclease subunit
LLIDKSLIAEFKQIDLKNAKHEISKSKGIYIWLNKNDEIVYVGIACGSNGLYHRICNQHLNPNYLEFRESKHNEKDIFQLEHAITKLSSKNILKKGIDKSSFRKSIGRNLKLKPGIETCNFIMENLQLKIFESNHVIRVKKLEVDLISQFNPRFNTSHKKSTTSK